VKRWKCADLHSGDHCSVSVLSCKHDFFVYPVHSADQAGPHAAGLQQASPFAWFGPSTNSATLSSSLLQLRHCCSLNRSPADGGGASCAFRSGADSTAGGEAAALQAFTQQIDKKSSREIFSVAKQIAVWRTSEALASSQVAVASFAQQAAALLQQRKKRRREVSIMGTVELLRASTSLAEILHEPQCPALPYTARRACASVHTGGPAAACVEVMNYVSMLQNILETQVGTANNDVSSTELLTALQANVQALHAVAAAPGAPEPDVSKQIQQCTISS
jgi:hypothetical protein